MTDLTARPDPLATWRDLFRGARSAARARRRPAPTGTARCDPRPDPPGPARLLAEAVRLELTHPGSVPAARQFDLIMDDRATTDDGPCPCPRDGGAWTPFRSAADPCPYRPLAAGPWDAAAPPDPGAGAHPG